MPIQNVRNQKRMKKIISQGGKNNFKNYQKLTQRNKDIFTYRSAPNKGLMRMRQQAKGYCHFRTNELIKYDLSFNINSAEFSRPPDRTPALESGIEHQGHLPPSLSLSLKEK